MLGQQLLELLKVLVCHQRPVVLRSGLGGALNPLRFRRQRRRGHRGGQSGASWRRQPGIVVGGIAQHTARTWSDEGNA